MFDEALPQERPAQAKWSVAASFLLHVILAIALTMQWQATTRQALDLGEGVPVDYLTSDEFDALVNRRPPQTEEVAPPPPESRAPPQTANLEPPPARPPATKAAPAMIHASRMLSAEALAKPRNRSARQSLPKLNDTERMVQLCDIEAMEQLAQWRHDLRPELVSAYATRELAIEANTVEADGAAFRSGSAWYNLKFRCQLSPSHQTVVAFDFLAGDQVSPDRLEELNLPLAPP